MQPLAPPALLSVLQRRFGHDAFRPGQLPLIEAVLSGRDALGVLPTGGGKSLIYQLPAAILPGVTVVVSPLIALMKDQVDALNRRAAVPAVAIHSHLTQDEVRQALGRLAPGKAALLYLSPERLEQPGWRERLVGLRPQLFVVDEAHCVHQWGFDFRPSYLVLKDIVEALRPCPLLALTATATPAVRQGIVARLGLQAPLVHVASFDRPNLSFEVIPCAPASKSVHLERLLHACDGAGSQIVYVGRRRDATALAAELTSHRLPAVAYHAGMTAPERQRAQEAWQTGQTRIAVATIAFGMGIDKPDVRAVIHFQHPASLESYYQEAGRAGRDGAPARCIVLFSESDRSLAEFFIRRRYPAPGQIRELLDHIPPDGVMPKDLALRLPGWTAEQRHTALLTLIEQGYVRKEENGLLERTSFDPGASALDLEPLRKRERYDRGRLEAMVAYCQDRRCHRASLLRYFGETLAADHRCGHCSACIRDGRPGRVKAAASTSEWIRVLQRHAAILRAALPTGDLLDPQSLARFAKGSRSERMPPDWRRLEGFGALTHVPLKELRKLAARALAESSEESALVPPVAAPAHPPPIQAQHSMMDRDVFWRSNERAYSAGELRGREVARRVGLAILQLVAEAEGRLPPSGVANVLRGAQGSTVLKAYPDLAISRYFGALGGIPYDDLVLDVVAMQAKGYLQLAQGTSKRLALSVKGRAVLARK
jgi:RecQ family ATP-dependent DNA helicase